MAARALPSRAISGNHTQPARCRHKDVAASLKLTSLIEDTGPSIRHHTFDHRTLSKLPRLIVDLDCQLPDVKQRHKKYKFKWLPGGCDDDTLGSSSCVGVSLDHAVDDWKQKCSSLARTSLCNVHLRISQLKRLV